MEKTLDLRKEISSSFIKHSKFAEGQFTQLAGAIPQEKFSWRPEEGARSVAEAFLHAALGNYLILRTLGGQLPDGVDLQKLEKSTTDKKQIVEELGRSFELVNKCIADTPESEYGTEVDFFGTKSTKMDMIFSAATHHWESLGQTIAYSRMNRVTPPWSVKP